MKYFFTALKYIKLIDLKSDYLEIMPGIRITNSDKIKRELITEEVFDVIGRLNAIYFSEAETYIYFTFEDDDYDTLFSNLDHFSSLEMLMVWIDDFLKNMWIFKDNCVMCDQAFLIDVPIENQAKASSIVLVYSHTLANGEHLNVTFNELEFNEIIKLHDDIENYFHSKNSSSLNFMLEKGFSRLSRALIFIKQAREARNLAYKISNYCSALESILSTDDAEISHKISERCAFLLSKKRLKIETYKKIKTAYNVRSKLTHGATLDNKTLNQLFQISFDIDDILRDLILLIIKDKNLLDIIDGDISKLAIFFNELIFENTQ